MTFNSISYFIFLPIVYLVFYFSPNRFRWLVLLVASYGFYASFKAPQLLIVLALVTVISYVCGNRLGRTTEECRRKRIFQIGTAGCVLILAVMKYLPSFVTASAVNPPFATLLISIGVSYFTFQAISYLADVYLEIQEPAQGLGHYALSLAFFPKLLQGPIERAADLLPQLKKTYEFDYDAMRSGMLLFTWGLFKKIVVADRLALYSNTVYNDVHAYTGLPLIIGTYAYALQIYFDFAGYTDMARGAARMFGVNLAENFNRPYLATSIADFWRRWHMSFSRWILDYIFKPLQMAWRDHGQAGTALALIVTFLISGIWHGASWGFVVWGLLHGFYLAVSTYYRPYQKRLHKLLGIEKKKWLKAWQVFITFNLVSFAWIFFRAGSLSDAWYVVNNCLNLYSSYASLHSIASHEFVKMNVLLNIGRYELFILIVMLAATFVIYKKSDVEIFKKPTWYRWSVYSSLIVNIILFRVSGNTDFIYRQF
ncbi:MAG: MBOAT family protein [Chlorobium sp.]|nr:MBOAT family protein [Chlorobium sp.]